MDLSQKGAAFVRLHEGFVRRYYLDPVNIGTIGIDFTWGSDSFREWWGKNKPGSPFAKGATMTREEADSCLRYLCEREYGKAVNGFLGKQVPQHVFDGTVSPVYNLGPGSLEWQRAAAVKRGDYAEAARLLETTGTTAQGKRLAGLVRRRKEEALLISTGRYTGVDLPVAPSKPDAMADGVLVRGERGATVAALIRDLRALGYTTGSWMISSATAQKRPSYPSSVGPGSRQTASPVPGHLQPSPLPLPSLSLRLQNLRIRPFNPRPRRPPVAWWL
jgi:lysozyme